MSDGKQWFGGKSVVALIVAGSIIIAIAVFLFGLIRLGWEFAVPWSARRRPVVVQKIKRTAETVERFIGPQQR